MTQPTLEQKVDALRNDFTDLESILGRFILQTDLTLRRLEADTERSRIHIQEIITEMRADAERAKTEIREEAERRRQEAERQREADREEAERRRQEAERRRQEFEQEMEQRRQQYERERRQEQREWNKRWGELSNKMGTIVEDIIAPSLRRMAQEELNCGVELFFAQRLSRARSDDPRQTREFDAFYVGEHAVLLNESKATARPEYAQRFVEFLQSGEFFLYFPEYQAMPIVPVFSSLELPDNIITYLTRHGIYAVAMGDEAMEVLNLQDVER